MQTHTPHLITRHTLTHQAQSRNPRNSLTHYESDGQRRGGFPGLSVRAEAPTTIYLTYDEILQPDGYKYMRVVSVGGRATVSAPYLRTYESPSAARAQFRSSDPALERIFAAAKASYVANAVDCLTDCPNRERGGWLGDTCFATCSA